MNQHIENLNYYHDRRVTARAPETVLYTEEGEIELPTKYEVCDLCHGEGKHVNPAIDCGGLSREDFDEDPDFAENYMSGMYDVPCNQCHGRTTVKVVDRDALSPELREAYDRQLQDLSDERAEHMAELAAGA